MIREGDLLAGKYRVEQVLGAGGMGYVVAARHEQLGQRVAVKLLVPELCENEDSVARFLREARAAVRIHSEHVARVIDVGELTNGAPYMVMEFLSGRDLADELDLPGQLEVPQAIDYVLQASEAVAEAHSIGVIHRDLKPANLFLTQRPDGSPLVKVLDFGISKAINVDDSALEPAPSLTATHSLLGSPAYMSPEQIRRPKTVDTRTDIWSLGSILYELLAREPPFHADSPLALLAAVVSDPLPSIRDKRPDVAPELEAVIAKCLEKNPDNRYQTVAELADALAPFAPRSQPSISRISGILRSASVRPGRADKSPSSERTLQSPGPPISGAETEELKVEVVTPFVGSEKSTKTDWEASTSIVKRTRRRALVAVGGAAALAAVVIGWQRRSEPTADIAPDPSVKAGMSAAPARPEPVSAPAPAAPPVPVAPPASSASSASARPASSEKPASASVPAPKPKLPGKPVAAAPAAPAAAPAPATPKPPTADPLDGRR
ncbi:MAG TPA: serine/threonine-protein kinase [Polyangiaceae bacterium]|nr:serine/threonine-protein kinase [Polyangiaceae bacterium]